MLHENRNKKKNRKIKHEMQNTKRYGWEKYKYKKYQHAFVNIFL